MCIGKQSSLLPLWQPALAHNIYVQTFIPQALLQFQSGTFDGIRHPKLSMRELQQIHSI